MPRSSSGPTPPSTSVISAEATERIVTAVAEAKIANLREILGKKEEIAKMRTEDVDKLAKLLESNVAHGSCGIGCW